MTVLENTAVTERDFITLSLLTSKDNCGMMKKEIQRGRRRLIEDSKAKPRSEALRCAQRPDQDDSLRFVGCDVVL